MFDVLNDVGLFCFVCIAWSGYRYKIKKHLPTNQTISTSSP
jgi:hypothetical protein